jgi:hypothetical protein
MALTTVYTAQDEFLALSIRDLLAADGIQCLLFSNELPGFGGVTWLDRPWGEVRVEEEDADRALELIGGFLGSLGELTELDETGG